MKGRVIALTNLNNLDLNNFLVDPNFDQFITLIRGDDQTNSNVAESFRSFEDESVVRAGGGDDYNDGDDSSATTTNNDGSRKKKMDRSKTLISERRSRSRMKDKLYAMRALVPNITKMDKVSIVGDAVSFVQEMQSQAKKLKADIAALEASLNSTAGYQEPALDAKKPQTYRSINPHVSKKINQMDVIQVKEKAFYVRLVCNKGEDIAPSLYKSLESLTSFQVQNPNL
ncbi:unnamed protein product, partial [Eruca vesicaria subsp. sativa]|nr:unnamed protein product [Eruca vesicaria subsp. sativa]